MPQTQDDNNNFVGIEQLANSNHNCEVYVDQNQNVEVTSSFFLSIIIHELNSVNL